MIENLLKTKAVRYDVSLPGDIIKYINHFYHSPEDESSITEILGKLDADDEDQEEDEEIVNESDSVIMQLVNKIILDAQARRASDIHIEPNVWKKNVEVRYRVDGDCAIYQTLPYNYRAAVVSRIKIMSNLDITVRRLPQDGKIKFRKPGGEEMELRVATIPTAGGVEDVVMRILAKAGDTLPLTAMGMSPRNFRELRAILDKPYGMILVRRPHRLRKDDHPARRPSRDQPARPEDLDGRGPGGDHPVRPPAGPGPVEDRLRLRRRHARLSPGRPGRDHGGRNARFRNGQDRRRGVADGPPRLQYAPYEQCPGDDRPPPRHGDRPAQFRRRPPGDPRPASRPDPLQEMQRSLPPRPFRSTTRSSRVTARNSFRS